MPSFQDSVFLFILALLLFGPKKLPVLARELGKWVGEFRRASNEFKMQMEDELRQSEQADRLKKIEAMEAAAPAVAALPETAGVVAEETSATPLMSDEAAHERTTHDGVTVTGVSSEEPAAVEVMEAVEPLPIAESGEVKIMPPSTGLPLARSRNAADAHALGGLLHSIPAAEQHADTHSAANEVETAETAHGH